MARVMGVPAAGNLKIASGASTFASARSTVMRTVRGAPFRPDSTEKGNQTPATCS
jgi:hypothetical protein